MPYDSTCRYRVANNNIVCLYGNQELTLFSRAKMAMKYQQGVTSVEYALIASLIALAIVVGVGATGKANEQNWSFWTGKVFAALRGALGP
ncbi:MAG: Flp family type IVb pilin [Rhodoferax sp.]|nr:Flp family type IVb pilin [Rhodoferax sp.]